LKIAINYLKLFAEISENIFLVKVRLLVSLLFISNFILTQQAQHKPVFEVTNPTKYSEVIDKWQKEPFGKNLPESEIIEKRDEYSKHFKTGGNQFVAHIAAGPIHYQENGTWKTIYHSIDQRPNGFENLTNAHKTYYPLTLGHPLRTVLPDGNEFKDLIGLEYYFEGKGQKTIPKPIQSKQGQVDFNELIYPAAFPNGMDVRLTQNTTQRKMDYILRNSAVLNNRPSDAEFMVFREIVELPIGWKAELVNNEILLFDGSGRLQAKYNRPVFYDSHEETHDHDHESHEFFEHKNYSAKEISGTFELNNNGNQIEILTKVPLLWLISNERVYPIYIDPTLTLNPDNTGNWTGSVNTWTAGNSGNGPYTSTNIHESFNDRIFLGHACGAGYYDGASYVGGSSIADANDVVGNGWIRFNTSSVASGLCITSISLNTFVYDGYLTNAGVCQASVKVRHMNSDPVGATNANRLTDIRDGTVYADVNFSGNNNLWRTYALNNTTYNDMLSGTFSVGLETYQTLQSHHEHEYVLMRGHSNSNKPFITINYNDNVTAGTFTLNTQANNISACPGSNVTIAHAGWNNGGGTMAYYVGTENPVNSGWVSTWDLLSGACPNQTSCNFTVPSVPEGTRLIVHSNAYNGCSWGPGVTRIITVTCCATTNAGTLQHQNTVQTLCHGQTVSANNITSTSLNAGTGTLRTVWFVGEWGWTGTQMDWINWRESTPGAPAGGVYSANLNAAVGGGNGDGQSMSNYNPQIDFPNNNRFYIIRGSYNPTCASWCVPACVSQVFEVIIRPPIPTPTVSNSGPICANSSITLSADGLAPQGKSLAATSAAAQMTIPNATLGVNWTLEAWSRFPLNNSGTYNTLFRNAGGGGGGGDHQILTQNGILGSWSNTVSNGPTGFHSSGFNITTLSPGWHHIAAVGSGGVTKFYIDGTMVGQIGWQSDNSVQLINGLSATQAWGEIDNARIWNTARSVANILTDMHRNIPTLDLPNLIANYTFDASNGNAVNNGTFNATGIIDCAFNDVNFFTFTWTGTNAPAPSASITQTVTNPAPGNYSLTVSANGCSSTAAITTVNGSPAPTGAATQTFCSTVSPTIASLVATGTAIQWYGTATGGSPLPTTFGLSDGATYYATQTVSGCESPTRLAVTVTVNPVGVSPAITGSTNLCWNGTTTLTPEYPTGGTVTNVGGYRIHTFIGDGQLTVPTGFSGQAEVLVLAGGGGGGGCIGGGGGAGGLQFSTVNLTPGSKTVVVGAGGIGGVGWNNSPQQGSKGGDSQFDAITALGGGGGGIHGGVSAPQTNLWNGGSGGGGGNTTTGFGTGTVGQGKNGGTGGQNNGGGGGGFGGVGGFATGVQVCNPSCVGGIAAGDGGQGVYFPQFTANGSPAGWFAGGGGGGARVSNGTAGTGGNGGGMNGTTSNTQATAAPANTGGGGGGGGHSAVTANQVGGNGGSGIVIVRYYIGTPTWTSQNPAIATVSNGTVTGVTPGGSTTIDYTVAAVGACPSTTVSIPVNVIGGQRIAPTGPQCSGTQLNFEALPNPSVSGTTISWTVSTPSGLSASPTSGNANLFSTTLTNSTSGTLQPTITVSQTVGSLTCTRSFTPNILAPIIPTFNALGPYCVGESPASLQGTSNNGIAGTWSPTVISTASAGSVNYTFTPNSVTACETTASLSITVNNCNNFGEFASAVYVETCSNNASSNSYFNTTGNVSNQISPTPFQGHNFGNYFQNSGQLKLNGGEMKTWKNNPGNVCGVTVYYRVYPVSTTPPVTFSSYTLPFYENCNSGSFPSGGPCGGNDQKWQRPGNGNPLANIDLTTYAPDTYILEIYYDILGSHTSNSNCDATVSVNNGGANFISQFTIVAPPTASNTGAYCAGQTIQLNATNGGTSYSWSGPNAFANGTQNPSISNATTSMAGTYTVSVSTANNCHVTSTTNVVVNANPSVQVTCNSLCAGSSTTVSATPNPAGTYIYSWTVPSGPNPGDVSNFSTNISGQYSVIVTDTSTNCPSQSNSCTVNLYTSPGVIYLSPPE